MPTESCAICGGSGWVIAEKDGFSGAQRCECAARQYAAEREDRAGIPPQFQNASLDNFKLPADNPVARNALSSVYIEIRRFAKEFPLTSKPGLLLVGGTGIGKTHLAVAALKILMSRGFEGVFFDYQTLLEKIQRSWGDSGGASDKGAYKQALDTEILLLDDLGARRSLDWVEDTVTAIITHRYNHKKSLIATTNLPDPALGDSLIVKNDLPGSPRTMRSLADVIGERSRSRLFEMCRVVRMPAVEDYRLKQR
ncbi:MAG TPA: ATP-binding protein [Bryobacteraceae bacterium]|nr:ATP-binding protein [Bryobacteraceae bacterium]